MWSPRAVLLPIIGLALLLTSCGGDDDATSSTPTPPANAVGTSLTSGGGFVGPFDNSVLLKQSQPIGQTFTAPGGTLAQVSLWLGSSLAPTPRDGSVTLTVSLSNAAPNKAEKCTGAALATATATVPSGFAATITSTQPIRFDITPDVAITAGTVYCLEVDPDDGLLSWASTLSNLYPGGIATAYGGYSMSGGAVDFGFELWMAP